MPEDEEVAVARQGADARSDSCCGEDDWCMGGGIWLGRLCRGLKPCEEEGTGEAEGVLLVDGLSVHAVSRAATLA